MKILILYATTTGNTEYVAQIIKSALKGCEVDLKNVNDEGLENFNDYDLLIFGTPTWGEGTIHKDWKTFIENLQEDSLKGKRIALFGLGDSLMFPKHFVNGLGELYSMCLAKGANILGSWEIEGYKFENSKALISGKFCGLVLDQENEAEQTVRRVNEWIRKLLLEAEETDSR
ncbi:MAG: flavodoxin [Candidatus Hydrogenedentes bacterium]|nr:flavodoxin [Candidatus Hydrogenedentota bacterium]